MKKYFLLLVIVVLFIACSDESSDDSISDTVHKDVFSDTINPSDTAEIRDSVEIKDIQDAGPDAKDISDITDTDSSDSLTDTGSDTSVITDITGSDTAEDTVPGDTGDIVIIDISDIQGQDTGSDNIIYDAMTDTSGEDISDSGDTDAGLMQPVINELMILPNYSDTELGQYIEIYNPNSFGIDINGYRLKTDKNEFIISNSDCDTVINAGSYLVAGATKDSLKNSYAKVKCEWKDLFTLTNATYLELVR
ncbi:MAG: lamin tail domain-containing protein, partial [Deltaproteobacteria bacterium]|nr:lamin tail domain-containing protein [Deltaproteobacteria bacterium]